MRLRDAKKLYNEDQVILKRTKEVCKVLNEPRVFVIPGTKQEWCHIELVFPDGSYKVVSHTEVE